MREPFENHGLSELEDAYRPTKSIPLEPPPSIDKRHHHLKKLRQKLQDTKMHANGRRNAAKLLEYLGERYLWNESVQIRSVTYRIFKHEYPDLGFISFAEIIKGEITPGVLCTKHPVCKTNEGTVGALSTLRKAGIIKVVYYEDGANIQLNFEQ